MIFFEVLFYPWKFCNHTVLIGYQHIASDVWNYQIAVPFSYMETTHVKPFPQFTCNWHKNVFQVKKVHTKNVKK